MFQSFKENYVLLINLFYFIQSQKILLLTARISIFLSHLFSPIFFLGWAWWVFDSSSSFPAPKSRQRACPSLVCRLGASCKTIQVLQLLQGHMAQTV